MVKLMKHSQGNCYALHDIRHNGENVELTSFKRACVLVPHPDDEAIGCGGLIAALTASGCEVHTILASNGSGGPDAPFNASAIRLKEFEKSVGILGAQEYERLLLEDSMLSKHREIMLKMLKEHILRLQPDLLITPWSGDPHPDHNALAMCTEELTAAFGLAIIEYEVWAPLKPTHALDITDFISIKEKAIQAHVTALRFGNYLNAAIGLAKYRTLLLPFHSENRKYVEAFRYKA